MFLAVLAEHLEHSHGVFEELLESFFSMLIPFSEEAPHFLSHFTVDLLRTSIVFLIVLYIVSYAKTYLSAEKVRNSLLKVNRFAAVLLAALAGIFSSTCVCTNAPIFLGFLAFGVPLSLSITYLISSSLINIASLLSMWAICGWKFTVCYIAASFTITVIAGSLLSLFSQKKYLLGSFSADAPELPNKLPTQKERFHRAGHELWHVAKEQWLWILLGVAVSALIESFVSLSFAEQISSLGFFGVFLATIIGVVLHVDIIAIVPVLSALLDLHISYGLLFSLTVSLSFFAIPVLVMLKKAVRARYVLYSWLIMFVLILVAGAVMTPLYQ